MNQLPSSGEEEEKILYREIVQNMGKILKTAKLMSFCIFGMRIKWIDR